MQTFVPLTEPDRIAQVLDMKRLGKQRVETLQILQSIARRSGWINHPATQMWVGHEKALIEYGVAICDEWISRGYRDTCRNQMIALWDSFPNSSLEYPRWWGDDAVHSSHRSNLLRKHPEWYGKFGWTDDPNAPYLWPLPETVGA